jgi:hypothetical protein
MVDHSNMTLPLECPISNVSFDSLMVSDAMKRVQVAYTIDGFQPKMPTVLQAAIQSGDYSVRCEGMVESEVVIEYWIYFGIKK